MTKTECELEDDVLAAVDTSRWPDRVDVELRTHAAACSVCRDVIAVAIAFAQTDASIESPSLPDPQVVWLRSQIRARAEAMRLAERPITVAHALALASVVGLAGTFVGASSSWVQHGLNGLGKIISDLDPRHVQVPAGLEAIVAEHLGVVAWVGISLMVMPLAVYWATREN